VRKTATNSRRPQPLNLEHAFDLCGNQALKAANLSVDGIAHIMGEARGTLYRWMADGSMPVRKLPTFEHVCQADYVSRFLATAKGNRVVIEVPVGRRPKVRDINALQAAATQAVGSLIRFVDGEIKEDEVLADMNAALEGLMYQRENILKFRQPELDFGEGHE
jgi:predicted site-specific integrase-resolvase